MSIFTDSAFIYGHNITVNNNLIPFSEGGPELIAEIEVGSYSFSDYIDAVAAALNEAGDLEYTVGSDRAGRILTIEASGTFSLLVLTGSVLEVSNFSLMGFSGVDRTGSDSYSGDLASGSVYLPQFKLQEFIHADDDFEANQATVNVSTSGLVKEVVSYGLNEFFSFNISMANNYEHDQSSPFKENLNGVEDLRDFLKYITGIKEIEFVPDVDDYNTFYKLLLEKTPESDTGTAARMKELYGRGLIGFFETGNLKFRKL